MKNIVIFILTNNNEKLLKIVYNTVLKQKNHNFIYNIIIVVNSLKKNYYKDVLKEFENIDVEIIKTKSNGRPGMGHNSCINLFKIRKEYNYMIMIDGDDFLYPYALNQLNKCFEKKKHLDILMLKSTDKLKYIENNNYDLLDINLNNNFAISTNTYVDYKLYPWNKEHIKLSNFYNNSLCTPLRLFLLHRNIFNYIKDDLYHNECSLYDDYLLFLYYIRLSQIDDLECYIIPGKYIYLYNNINENSQTNNSEENDMIHYEKLKSKFIDVKNYLGNDWDITKLKTLYISHYKETGFGYKIDENNCTINMNINIINVYNDPNYIYSQSFGIYIINEIIKTYFHNSIKYLEKSDFNLAFKYSSFFDKYSINHPYMSFIYIYSIFNIYNNNLNEEFNYKIIKHYYISNNIIKFYNMSILNTYINNILENYK